MSLAAEGKAMQYVLSGSQARLVDISRLAKQLSAGHKS